MHNFNELISISTNFTIDALNHESDKIFQLEHNCTTVNVKYLQVIALQKAIIATGMFSIFEAELQHRLNCTDGFKELSNILKDHPNKTLSSKFRYFRLAINVLKHGMGPSFEILLSEYDKLPFRIRRSNEEFYNEGDVDEMSTLVKIDDKFLRNCAELISEISEVVKILR